MSEFVEIIDRHGRRRRARILPTLQDWCCHHSCKARFRLAGSPLPGGSRTLRIATKGFRSHLSSPFSGFVLGSRCQSRVIEPRNSLSAEALAVGSAGGWRKGSFMLNLPLASRHSITSSARSRKSRLTVSPRVRAVLRLTTSSNLLGCSTGKLAGFSPFRIFPT
jgi:hypothetical protein